MGASSFAVIYPAPVSASCADNITASMILHTTRTAAFDGGGVLSCWIGMVGLLLKNAYAPARDLPLDSHRYEASEWAHKCMSLATYLIEALGCVCA